MCVPGPHVCPWSPCVFLALVCVPGPRGTKGSVGALPHRAGALQVPWEVTGGPGLCAGHRGCFCPAWKGADGGEETVLGRGACPGGLLPLPSHFLPVQGLVGSSGGQQGPSLPLSASGTVPDMRPLGKQEHRADLISLWYLAVPTPLPVFPVWCYSSLITICQR